MWGKGAQRHSPGVWFPSSWRLKCHEAASEGREGSWSGFFWFRVIWFWVSADTETRSDTFPTYFQKWPNVINRTRLLVYEASCRISVKSLQQSSKSIKSINCFKVLISHDGKFDDCWTFLIMWFISPSKMNDFLIVVAKIWCWIFMTDQRKPFSFF